jgi:hypothetical protein
MNSQYLLTPLGFMGFLEGFSCTLSRSPKIPNFLSIVLVIKYFFELPWQVRIFQKC